MTIAIARDPIYLHRRFQPEIIELRVRWYLTYRLSYRGHCHLGAGPSMAWSRPPKRLT